MNVVSNRSSILIPYQHFLHMQTLDSVQAFTPYTIDKTHYYDFAITLFGELYKGYSKDECMMFDSPNVDHIEFAYLNDNYEIVAVTSNQQVWTYTFKSVDNENKYLVDKHITVATK